MVDSTKHLDPTTSLLPERHQVEEAAVVPSDGTYVYLGGAKLRVDCAAA